MARLANPGFNMDGETAMMVDHIEEDLKFAHPFATKQAGLLGLTSLLKEPLLTIVTPSTHQAAAQSPQQAPVASFEQLASQYYEKMKDSAGLSDNLLTKKLAENLTTTDVSVAALLVRNVLVKLKPHKPRGKSKSQSKFDWSLPPAHTKPLPSLLPHPTQLSVVPVPLSRPGSRLLPLRCWTLTGLEFKATDGAPAYNASKHTFFIDVVNRQGNIHKSVSLAGRLKSGTSPDVGHIPFSAFGLRYSFDTDAIIANVPNGLNARILVDLVNGNSVLDHTQDVVCKLKPLFGYGRIESTFVLRQVGQYWIRLTLEVPDTVSSDTEPALMSLVQQLRSTLAATAYFAYELKGSSQAGKKLKAHAVLREDRGFVNSDMSAPAPLQIQQSQTQNQAPMEIGSSTSNVAFSLNNNNNNSSSSSSNSNSSSSSNSGGQFSMSLPELKSDDQFMPGSDFNMSTPFPSFQPQLAAFQPQVAGLVLALHGSMKRALPASDQFDEDNNEVRKRARFMPPGLSLNSTGYADFETSQSSMSSFLEEMAMYQPLSLPDSMELMASSTSSYPTETKSVPQKLPEVTTPVSPGMSGGKGGADDFSSCVQSLQNLYVDSQAAPQSPAPLVNQAPQLISADGNTLKLICDQGEWQDGTHVIFSFGAKGSCVADGSINRFRKHERIVFIPPIPEHISKSVLDYLRSVTNQYMSISPTLTAAVVVSNDVNAVEPVVGYFVYTITPPVVVDTPGSNNSSPKRDDQGDGKKDNDEDMNGGGSGGPGTAGSGGSNAGAGLSIVVQQRFTIPYTRLRDLVYATSAGATVDLRNQKELATRLINGAHEMIQSYVSRLLAAAGPSPESKLKLLKNVLGITLRKAAKQNKGSPQVEELEAECSMSSLYTLMRRSLQDRMHTLISKNALNSLDTLGLSLAHYAAAFAQRQLLGQMVAKGADLNLKSATTPAVTVSACLGSSYVAPTENKMLQLAQPVTPTEAKRSPTARCRMLPLETEKLPDVAVTIVPDNTAKRRQMDNATKQQSQSRSRLRLFLSVLLLFAIAVAAWIAMVLHPIERPTPEGGGGDKPMPPFSHPAFPGAEGHGTGTEGGRGGDVVTVTSLAGYGPGSLQDALSKSGPRTIVFGVAGVIHGNLVIPYGHVTISGHSAPAPGITILGSLTVQAAVGQPPVTDVVVRHLRIRVPAPASASPSRPSASHAILINGANRVVLDHLTLSWSPLSLVRLHNSHYVTVSWCAFEEPAFLSHWTVGEPIYDKTSVPREYVPPFNLGPDFIPALLPESDSAGDDVSGALTTSGTTSHISFHHNLVAHASRAAPQIANGPADIRANLIYDFNTAFAHAEAPAENSTYGHTQLRGVRAAPGDNSADSTVNAYGINVVGNVFRDRQRNGGGQNDGPYGPESPTMGAGALMPFVCRPDDNYWIKDNLVEGLGLISDIFTTWNNMTTEEKWSKHARYGLYYCGQRSKSSGKEHNVVNPPVTTENVMKVEENVLALVGMLPRDEISERVLSDVRRGTGWPGRLYFADSVPEVPVVPYTSSPDGIPDSFVEAAGYPRDTPQRAQIVLANGYTLLEFYHAELAAQRVNEVAHKGQGTQKVQRLVVVGGRQFPESLDPQEKDTTVNYQTALSRVDIEAAAAPEGQVFDRWSGPQHLIRYPYNTRTFLLMPSSDLTISATYKNKDQ